MIRDFICDLEQYSEEIWRHYCKLRSAKNSKELFDSLKGIARIIDNIINRFYITS